jgi:glycosyltransferase involved in cell wall biosynthesis
MNKADTFIILSPGFPKDEDDSTCVPPQQVFVKSLKETFPQLNIIVLAFEYPYKAAKYQWNGIDVIAFGGSNKGGLSRMSNWRKIRAKLGELHNKYHIIGLLSFWLGDCALIGTRFAKRKQLKHLCWILGQDAKKGNRYFKLIKPQPASLIALSDFIANEVGKNYGVVPEHIISPGIDILGAGSLIPLKQFYMLIELVNSLKEAFPGIKAVICGGGSEMASLKAMIRDFALEEHITLTGELPHDQVLNRMERSKVFVHPSAYEGFGVVCLEALYAGAQVVSLVKPMQADIKNWHVARSQSDMVDLVKELLYDQDNDHLPVVPYLIKDSAVAMMSLFGYNESTTS